MNTNNVFEFENIKLIEIQESDLELIKDWRNSENTRMQFIYNKKLTSENQIDWYSKYKKKDNDIMFMIYEVDRNEPIGVAALYNIDRSEAEFGRLMIGNDRYKGKGFGRVIVSALVEYGFTKLNLKRIYLEVFEDNKSALVSYERVGFNKNGITKVVNDRTLVSMEILQ